MAAVWGPSRRSTSLTSRPSVRSSISANTGRAPTRRTALAVDTNVNEGHTTSSPGPTPKASRAGQQSLHPAAEGAVAGHPARQGGPYSLRLPFVEPGLRQGDGGYRHVRSVHGAATLP